MKKTAAILISLAGLISSAMAQPNSATVFEEVTDTPVNSGLVAMIALAVVFGVVKLYNKGKQATA